jgi:hypothetical protein
MSKTETTRKFTIPQEIADRFGIPATIEVKIEEEYLNPMALSRKVKADHANATSEDGYTKNCNGCNGQIVMRQFRGKWSAMENYDTDDYHKCESREPKLTD